MKSLKRSKPKRKPTKADSPALAQAIELATLYSIPSVWGPRGSKHPVIPRWAEAATSDPEKLRAMDAANPGCNFHLVMGNGFIAIDVDGREGLAAIEAAGLELPDTYTQITPGGGLHFVYRLPEGVHMGNRTGVLPKVDVRGEGGQIVCAGSIHPNGGRYEVAK